MLRHTGEARRHPQDRDVPGVGDELATCRVLAGLTHDLSLLDATVGDVEQTDPLAGGRPHPDGLSDAHRSWTRTTPRAPRSASTMTWLTNG